MLKYITGINHAAFITAALFSIALMAPIQVSADWEGTILSERPSRQALDGGWADADGMIHVGPGQLVQQRLQIQGVGTLEYVVTSGTTVISEGTLNGKYAVAMQPAFGGDPINEPYFRIQDPLVFVAPGSTQWVDVFRCGDPREDDPSCLGMRMSLQIRGSADVIYGNSTVVPLIGTFSVVFTAIPND